jgi:flavin reductase (DIM6/NTAB) family NADH-FMN oxidoreductase RutF
MKVKKRPYTALFPCPVVLVTCKGNEGKTNIITLAWAGIVCSDPPMIGISIRPHRFSYKLIDDSGEFVVNIPTEDLLGITDVCGMISGKDIDKFTETNLTPIRAEKIKPPLIEECPVNIECVVRKKIPLGVHHLFIGEVVQVHVDENVLDNEGNIDYAKTSSFVYNQGEYWNLANRIADYGFSKK